MTPRTLASDLPGTSRDLAAATAARIRAGLADRDLDVDVVVAASPANVGYATGYRSVAGDLFRAHQMAAVIDPASTTLVCPAADTAPAMDAGVDAGQLVPYGRFYFEVKGTPDGPHPSRMADQHDGVVPALVEALRRHGAARGRVGLDLAGLGVHVDAVVAALPDMRVVDVGPWFSRLRQHKLPGEVDRLRRAARLAEQGIDRALQEARPGCTEADLAAVVGRTMLEGGGTPRFVVVTAGLRSALADAAATTAVIERGDLIRFDVGCTVEGYWSDMARTAVAGAATDRQADRYAALLAGEEAQLNRIRPGIRADDLFDLAVEVVEQQGITPYRRHHCGHGIGTEVYEPPIVAPTVDALIEEHMTFCLETPFYELGWGGMMVEDTVVVTTQGHERFTVSDRSLRELDW